MATEHTRNLFLEVQNLSRAELVDLLAHVQHALQDGDPGTGANVSQLRGLGKAIWSDVDVDDYVRREREVWDG